MSYVFDNSPLSQLFKSYYPRRFPTLWTSFDQLVNDGKIVSTREVLREIKQLSHEALVEWADQNTHLFSTPTARESEFVVEIFKVRHFQALIEQKKLLKGGLNADPFVVAKAATLGLSVVTLEKRKPGASKIPNICDHFGVECLNLEEFMEIEGWSF